MRKLQWMISSAVLLAASSASAQTWPAPTTWAPLTQGGDVLTDPAADADGELDIVGDDNNPAAYVQSDPDFLYFRFRLNETPLNQAGNDLATGTWGVLFDLDDNPDAFEAMAVASGVGGAGRVALYQNTTQSTAGVTDDPAEDLIASNPDNTHAQVLAAGSAFDGTPDWTLDIAVAWSDLANVGLTPGMSFAVAIGTGEASNTLNADIGAILADELGDVNSCAADGCNLQPLEIVVSSPGVLTREAQPTFAGHTRTGASVAVTIDETTIEAEADGTGNWSAVWPAALLDGQYSAEVASTDGADAAETTFDFTIDTIAPSLTVESPVPGDLVGGVMTVRGRSEEDAEVIISIDDVVVATVVSQDGFSVDVPREGSLTGGTHRLRVVARDAAGNRAYEEFDFSVTAPSGRGLDSDGDGLPDADEEALGTNPAAIDTDGDGLLDGDEFERRTDPNRADTDNDGIGDGREVELRTDPRLADTDGGGVSDRRELEAGTNPRDRDDDLGRLSELSGSGCATSGHPSGALWPLLLAFIAGIRRRR